MASHRLVTKDKQLIVKTVRIRWAQGRISRVLVRYWLIRVT